MKNVIFLSVLMFCCTFSLIAQQERTVFGKNGWRISGAWGGPAVGVGQLENELVVFRGGFGGIEFGKKLFLGWGGFETDNDVYIDALNNDRFKMDYSGFCLLYTSPSPRDLSTSRMPSSA